MSDSEVPLSAPEETPSAPAAPERTWQDLGLSEEALALIRKAGFERPTPVQAQSIPIALTGKDVIGSAQTGTGKTATFVLPMVEQFAGRQGTYGLILCPTREIAQQTQQTLELFGTPRGVRSIVLIGGIPMNIDFAAIQSYPQIIVATPGRLCDHLNRGGIWLDFIEIVVLDEADRMLDMGFSEQVNQIMDAVPQNRQTMLFSATMPPAVESLARKIMYEPERVSIGKPLATASTVEQTLLWMPEEARVSELRRLIQEEKGSIIVFARSKDGATQIWRQLHSRGVYDATYIHSDRLQAHREQALAEFKSGKYRVLIATDVAARGIHVDAVSLVINYELPRDAEDYVHRIGRTGRAEAAGRAISFVSPKDKSKLLPILKLIAKAPLTQRAVPGFRVPDFAPKEGWSKAAPKVEAPRNGTVIRVTPNGKVETAAAPLESVAAPEESTAAAPTPTPSEEAIPAPASVPVEATPSPPPVRGVIIPRAPGSPPIPAREPKVRTPREAPPAQMDRPERPERSAREDRSARKQRSFFPAD